MNRRGNIAIDLMLMAVVMMGIAVVYIYVNDMNNDILDPMIAQNMTGTQGTQMLEAQRANFAPLWDNLGILLFAGIWIFLLISAYYVDTSPIFFIVMAVLMIGSFIVIMIVANAFDSLKEDSNFNTNSQSFSLLSWLMGHFLEAVIVVLITVGIALYAKNDSGGSIS